MSLDWKKFSLRPIKGVGKSLQIAGCIITIESKRVNEKDVYEIRGMQHDQFYQKCIDSGLNPSEIEHEHFILDKETLEEVAKSNNVAKEIKKTFDENLNPDKGRGA